MDRRTLHGEGTGLTDSSGLSNARKRAVIMVVLFGSWSLVITARLVQVMLTERERFLAETASERWETGMIPAIRGRLLDIDGRPLAWSSRRFALSWQVPQDAGTMRAQWQAVAPHLSMPRPADVFARASRSPGRRVVVSPQLSPEAFAALSETVRREPAFSIQSHFVRHYRGNAELRASLGRVTVRGRMEIGMSGQELAHDSLLRGRPGLYRVQVDAAGAWIPETWEQVRDIQPGYDVYLPVRLHRRTNR